MNETTPKISIVIPIYNSEMFLRRCLDSIVQQTYDGFEVILVNDGSSDLSKKICEDYISDNRFHLYEQHNQGVSIARNNGIQKCKGEFIAFIDSDDFINDDYLEKMLSLCDSCAELIVSGIIYLNEYKLLINNRKQFRLPVLRRHNYSNAYEEYLCELKRRIPEPCFGAPYGKLYRKSIIENNFIKFEPRENLAEDLVFNLKYLRCISNISFLDYAGYNYRMLVSNSLSRVIHSYFYTKQRWDAVSEEYKKLFHISNLNCEHINTVIYKNIRYSILNDKSLQFTTKKQFFKKESNNFGKKENFGIAYFENIIFNLIKKIYRTIQVFVFFIRRKKL